MEIAVIADAHLHDVRTGYGTIAPGSGAIALRTLSDTIGSTRVFNESDAALTAALVDIHRRGIRLVVLLGDYSDDGQVSVVDALKELLAPWRAKGMQFLATFGNHDNFGDTPRHQTKDLTGADGKLVVAASSDINACEPAHRAPGMLGMSKPAAVRALADFGLMRPAATTYWETPFGTDDALEGRQFGGQIDASYLIEPEPGTWLVILDANVFAEQQGRWSVRADKAWDHVVAERPYILEWLADIVRRAQAGGKTLVAFSHYPIVPLLLDGQDDNVQVVGPPRWLGRMPSIETSRRIAATGLPLHFSGHMHVAGQVSMDGLVNVSVPSPVAFPGGYCIVSIDQGHVAWHTEALGDVPGFDLAFPAYRTADQHTNLLAAADYRDFLYRHLRYAVETVFLPEEWPADFRCRLGEAVALPVSCVQDDVTPLTIGQVLLDYYALIATGDVARANISDARRLRYRLLDDCHADWQMPTAIGRLLESLQHVQVDHHAKQ